MFFFLALSTLLILRVFIGSGSRELFSYSAGGGGVGSGVCGMTISGSIPGSNVVGRELTFWEPQWLYL